MQISISCMNVSLLISFLCLCTSFLLAVKNELYICDTIIGNEL